MLDTSCDLTRAQPLFSSRAARHRRRDSSSDGSSGLKSYSRNFLTACVPNIVYVGLRYPPTEQSLVEILIEGRKRDPIHGLGLVPIPIPFFVLSTSRSRRSSPEFCTIRKGSCRHPVQDTDECFDFQYL